MNMEDTFLTHQLTEDDIPELIALHQSVGWNSALDFSTYQMRLFLSLGMMFGHRDEGQLITCAGVYLFDDALASIGPVIVNPAYQRKGLGEQLMNRCLQVCRESGTIMMLIATEAGQRLYKSLGFETVGYIRRFVYEGDREVNCNADIQDMQTIQHTDLPRIINADQVAVGVDRSAFFNRHLANIASGFLLHNHFEHAFPSFGIGTQRGNTLQIGPLVGADLGDAMQLIHQFLATYKGSLRIDVPSNQHGFIEALQQLGFVETLTSPLMTLDGTSLPGRREHLYGIADPALG
jgi:N-acetylglutamate synthase-like GNAT family acetyltransferase